VNLRTASTKFTIIASGGISTGLEAAKCIALGADITASARPFLRALHGGKKEGLRKLLQSWAEELQGVMFLTGSATITALQHARLARHETA
jgi:isopentenyl-diphosphate delta-isomerase